MRVRLSCVPSNQPLYARATHRVGFLPALYSCLCDHNGPPRRAFHRTPPSSSLRTSYARTHTRALARYPCRRHLRVHASRGNKSEAGTLWSSHNFPSLPCPHTPPKPCNLPQLRPMPRGNHRQPSSTRSQTRACRTCCRRSRSLRRVAWWCSWIQCIRT